MNLLDRVDLDVTLEKTLYKKRLREAQLALGEAAAKLQRTKRSLILTFEGWDAAGKGGAIRRLVGGLDPRQYKVHPIAAPHGEDALHHYLWRFWRRLPPAGRVAIFDRSWYGRVLVERIEGFAKPDEWRRSFAEINHFETQLVDAGALVFKFWLHISPEVQLTRFEERRQTDYKSWKLTDEDWRNRDAWPAYAEAVDEMLRRTSTVQAPWTVTPANCKRYARVHVLERVLSGIDEMI